MYKFKTNIHLIHPDKSYKFKVQLLVTDNAISVVVGGLVAFGFSYQIHSISDNKYFTSWNNHQTYSSNGYPAGAICGITYNRMTHFAIFGNRHSDDMRILSEEQI